MSLKALSIVNKVLYAGMFVLVLIAFFIMFYNTKERELTSSGFSAFKYFTVLSNVFFGICCLILLIFSFVGKQPRWLSIVHFVAVVAVSLTFLTVMLYLAPLYGYKNMLQGANLYYHLIVPVLGIIQFLLFEPKGEGFVFVHNFVSVLPMLLYGVFYIINLVVHNGYGNENYDWYYFGAKGLLPGVLFFLILIVATFGMSVALYYGYRGLNFLQKDIS